MLQITESLGDFRYTANPKGAGRTTRSAGWSAKRSAQIRMAVDLQLSADDADQRAATCYGCDRRATGRFETNRRSRNIRRNRNRDRSRISLYGVFPGENRRCRVKVRQQLAERTVFVRLVHRT